MSSKFVAYHNVLSEVESKICHLLEQTIDKHLGKAESKVWHGHPVWFLDKNPIVGYSKQKAGIKLMFWSGADFEEADLIPGSGKFKDAGIFYTEVKQINIDDVKRWIEKSILIQWDYKNIVKRKGVLLKLT